MKLSIPCSLTIFAFLGIELIPSGKADDALLLEPPMYMPPLLNCLFSSNPMLIYFDSPVSGGDHPATTVCAQGGRCSEEMTDEPSCL